MITWLAQTNHDSFLGVGHTLILNKSEVLIAKTGRVAFGEAFSGDFLHIALWFKVPLFFFFFGHACGMWNFLGQGLNPRHSSGNTRSLTCWGTRELSCLSVLDLTHILMGKSVYWPVNPLIFSLSWVPKDSSRPGHSHPLPLAYYLAWIHLWNPCPMPTACGSVEIPGPGIKLTPQQQQAWQQSFIPSLILSLQPPIFPDLFTFYSCFPVLVLSQLVWLHQPS